MKSQHRKHECKVCRNTEVIRHSEVAGEVRDLAWQALGIAHLIKYTDTDAVPSVEETYGVGRCLEKIGTRLEEISEEMELTNEDILKTKQRLEKEK